MALINIKVHHYTMPTPALCCLSFLQKHFKFLKSFRANPPTQHPIFQRLRSAASKTFFSDPVLFRPHVRSLRTISPQTLLLIGYCLLLFTLSHCFEHTVACNTFAVFVTNRVVIYVCKVADIFRFTFGERFLEAQILRCYRSYSFWVVTSIS